MTDSSLGLTATDWTALGTIINGGMLLGAISAACIAYQQWRTGEATRQETRLAAHEAQRPYLSVTVEPAPSGPPLVNLVIRNIGARPAKDVILNTTPELTTTLDDTGIALRDARIFTEPIPMLAPGQTITALFDSLIRREQSNPPMDSVYEVSITYADFSDNSYQDRSILDLGAQRGTLHADTKTLHDLAKSVEELTKHLSRASLLESRTPHIEVTIEAHNERAQRISQEREVMLAQNRQLMEELGVEPEHNTRK